jgi:tetratricopeptide (TPR) repeat protein
MDPGILDALDALDADPDNSDALAQIAALSEGGGNGHGRAQAELSTQRALREARSLHRERGDFELVVRLIDLELGWETDRGHRADLYFEKGRIFSEELLREGEAVRCFERALELRPDDQNARDALSQIALVRDNWQKIVRKFLDEAKGATDRQLISSLFLSVAEVYAKFQPDGHVEDYLKRALDVDPHNHKCSQRLERLFRGEERWEELLALYEQRLEVAANQEERVQAYLLLGDLQARRMGRLLEAAESYKKALGIDPANARALSALVTHYTAEENWQALIRVYENALRVRPRGEPEMGMHLQIGMLWWRKLGNPPNAEEYFRRVKKADPTHPAMLEFYRSFYEADPQKLLTILGPAQKMERDPGRAFQIAVEMAEVAERSAATTEKAIDLWKAVLRQKPSHEGALSALCQLYRKTGKWNALLEILKEAADGLPKEAIDERITRLLEVAAIYRDKLNLDVMVINTYNQILQLAPKHEEALFALGQKYEQMGRWNDLVIILQRTADAAEDAKKKAALLRRVATLLVDKFGNHNQAVKPLEELHALDPEDTETLNQLRELYTRRRAWRMLLDLERKELDRIRELEVRRQKVAEMAYLCIDRLGDIREAIALWNLLLEIDVHDREALAELLPLYEREKRYPAVVEILRRQAGLESDPLQKAALLERVGALYTEKLALPDLAIETYREIVRLVPGHTKVVRTLRELYAQSGRFEELERLYAEQGNWEELCDALYAIAERTSAVAERLALYVRVAKIAHDQLRSPERASKAYERILGLDPANRLAALALLPIYRASEKWARLLSVYEVVLGHAVDDDEKLALHGEIRSLCEEKLGSKGLAFAWCKKAYAIRPGEPAIGRELERLAGEADAWQELSEIYIAEVVREPDPDIQVDRYRRLGQIALTKLYRTSDARTFYEEVLHRRPEDREALEALEQIFDQGQSYPELLRIYRKKESQSLDPKARLDLLFKSAWIEEEQLAAPDQAIATYRRALEISTEDKEGGRSAELRALRALEKLYSLRNDAQGLVGVLERQLRLASGDVDAQVQFEERIGELYEFQLKEPTLALLHYRAGFELAPTRPSLAAALERWLAPAFQERVEVARLLRPFYEDRLKKNGASASERSTDAAGLMQVVEILLDATSSEDEKTILQERRKAMALGPFHDDRRAYDAVSYLFEQRPGDLENRRVLGELAQRLECLDDLAVRLGKSEVEADRRGDISLALTLGWELAQVFNEKLEMPEDAESAYRRVLARNPEHGGALETLEALLRKQEKWAALREFIVDRKTRASSAQVRLHLIYALCDLDERMLKDDTACIADYEEMLELEPDSTRAFVALERLLSAREDWDALDGLYERRLPFVREEGGGASGESRTQLKYRRADLLHHRLNAPDRALDLYQETIDDDPHHEGARRGLEALMKVPDARLRAAKILQPIYLADEAWPKLALALAAEREAVSGLEAVALLKRLAGVQEEKLGGRQLALATWREALRLDPADKQNREQVERLALLLDRPAELGAALEEGLEAAEESDLVVRAEMLERLAKLYEGPLRDASLAKSTWRRLLELDPENPMLGRPAALALGRMYEAAEAWRELVEVLHRQIAWAESLEEKRQLLFRIGRIEEELIADPHAAIATYREALDHDPEDHLALEALERLYAAGLKWPELVEILHRRVDLVRNPEERRKVRLRIAELYERELHDPIEAIACHQTLLEESPEEISAIEALIRLFEAGERHVDLLEVLERRLAIEEARATPDAKKSGALRMRMATLEIEFGMRDRAVERYRRVLEGDPRHEGARSGLESLLDDPDLRLQIAEILERHYRAAGNISKLIEISELFAEYSPDVRERLLRLRRVAELRARQDDIEGAWVVLERAARMAVSEPELPALVDQLESLCEPLRRPRLITLYRELGPDILDAAIRERIYLAVATESQKLGDRATAREYYRRILESTPEHPRALDALEALYLQGQEWDSLYEVCVRRVELAATDHGRKQYLFRIAEVCEGPLNRPAEAIRAYEEVLTLFPSDLSASTALEAHYERAHRNHELCELLERRLTFADRLDEAVALRFRLAQLCEDALADNDRALEKYRATLESDPTHDGAIRALERYLDDELRRVSAAEVLESVYAARHDWPRLCRIYEIRLEAAEDQAARQLLSRRLARLYEEQLEDLERAFTWYGRIFLEDPEDRAIRDQLVRLAGVLNGWARLVGVYEDFLDRDPGDGPVTVEIVRQLGELCDDRLREVDRAHRHYRHLLELDPRDEDTFARLEKMLERAGRWAELADVLRDGAEVGFDETRKQRLLHRQAAVLEEQLSDREGAIAIYRSLIDRDEADIQALRALDRLYLHEERWADLIELLLRQLGHAEGPAWVALQLRLAAVYDEHVEDRSSAVEVYEAILERAPAHSEAISALEKIIVNRDQTLRVARILEPIYKEADAWQKLVVIYGAELDFIDDRPARIARLREIARLHETRGGNGRLAFSALERAWAEASEESDEEPETALFAELGRVAKLAGLEAELVATLEKVANGSLSDDLRARIYTRIGRMQEDAKRNAAAISAWRQVASLREDDFAAFTALARLLEAEGRVKELVEVLEKRASLTAEAEERRQLYLRIAELAEKALSDPEAAIAALRLARGIDEHEHDEKVLLELERLYRAQSAFRELAEVLATRIASAADPLTRRTLRFTLAELLEEELDDPSAAIDTMRAVVEDESKDASALLELIRLLEQERRWAEELEALDALVHITSGGDRWDLELRAASLVEQQLEDAEGAIARYARILTAGAAAEKGARTELERLLRAETTLAWAANVLEPYYKEKRDPEGLVELYELRLAAESGASERRELLTQIATVNESELGDGKAAFSAWCRALLEDPADERVQRELERLAEQEGALGELARIYEERSTATFDPDVQRVLECKLGHLYEAKLGDDERAIIAYSRALDLPSSSDVHESESAVLKALDRLLLRGSRYRELTEVLERQVECATAPAEQLELYHRLGAIKLNELLDLDGALAAFRAAIEVDPAHLGSREGLVRLLSSPAHTEAALDLLEPVYESDGNYRKSVELAEIRLTVLNSARDQASLLERIAGLHEKQLGDVVHAFSAALRALRLEPEVERRADELERLGRVGGLERQAAEAFEEVLATGVPIDIGRDVGLRAARLFEKVGTPERAEIRYVAVLEIDSEQIEALEALDRIYRVQGDVAKLARLLEKRAQAEFELEAKKSHFYEAARLYEGPLSAKGQAIAIWRKVLEVDETDPTAIDALVRLFEAEGRYSELVELLLIKARIEEDARAQIGLRGRIAAIYAEKLHDRDRAVDAYRDLLDLAPESVSALDALYELELARGNTLGLQEVLVRKLDAVGVGTAQVPIYRRLAEWALERQQSPEDAIGYLQEALARDSEDQATHAALMGLFERTERWHDLIDLLTSQADLRARAGDKEGEIERLVRAADVWSKRLQSQESAVELLERILQRDPSHLGALFSLAQVYESLSEPQKARDLLERASHAGGSEFEKAELQFRIGQLETGAGGEVGKAYFLRALEFDPTHEGALQALEKILREQGDAIELAKLLALRIAQAGPKSPRPLVLELARLYIHKLMRPDEARPYLEKAVAESPNDLEILEPLADLHFAAGRHAEAMPLYRKLVEQLERGRRGKEAGRLRARIGAVAEQQGDLALALAEYSAAFQIDATHPPTLMALGRLHMQASEWEKARKFYRSLLLQRIDPETGVSKAEVYFRLGEIHERLGEVPKAKGMYERGLEIDAGHASLRAALGRLQAL